MRAFRISEVDLGFGCREVRVEGELDLSVTDQLQRRLDAAVEEDLEVLVCLDQCDFIDSSGIAALLLAHKMMAIKGRRLAVCRPSPAVTRVLTVTGLTKDGLVYTSPEAALAERSGHAPLPARQSLQEHLA
jgi:anti-sigma B factor antagonist